MKGLKVQELISSGVYATVYFFVVAIATFLLRFTIPTFNTLFIPGLSALFSGVVYLIVINRVPKFGAITIVGSVMAIFFLVFGYFPLAFLPSVVFPLIADWIQNKTNLQEKLKTYLSYIVFSFGLTGPILPLWFMKEAYVASLLNRGKDMTYVNSVFAPITTTSFFISMGATLVLSILGLTIGQKIYQKHFSKEARKGIK
ncbi:MptD family putative ECF transporter S component [Vagococcus carniphilus]|uniref:MptD family putative ECF transporter S component n=1 Tax=Vagococcus carniphilus TaxID=218144 RepID=UPI00288E3328|nr:MptD family putative ECF transporter S component [Vagococcus carniphilus]MDT2814289.1 MptD family putative ECF transporter S component [Vagococcus carniphilus]MDT2847843.1 MptD family putative ECF transporter S component [Vagococcus carniphilus]MDT2864476.1 MptD family putative ECF transporter S component [Vagococcus carniphilus]